MNDEWIKKLKTGDKVYVKSSGLGSMERTTVKKITPKGYVRTESDYLFRNGMCKTGDWSWVDLVQWTQELEDELKAEAHFNQLAHSINTVDARTLTPEQVQKIYDIIKVVHNDTTRSHRLPHRMV